MPPKRAAAKTAERPAAAPVAVKSKKRPTSAPVAVKPNKQPNTGKVGRPASAKAKQSTTISAPAKVLCAIRPVSVSAKTSSSSQPITTADAYFQYLRDLNGQTPRATPIQVNLTKRVVVPSTSAKSVPLDRVYVVCKTGESLCLSPAFLACFYDISLNSTLEILGITLRCYRRIKTGLNIPRWPQQAISSRIHPLTPKMIIAARLQYMHWAFDKGDRLTYSLLYAGHECAGCRMAGIPIPESLIPAPVPSPATPVQAEQAEQVEPVEPEEAAGPDHDPPASTCAAEEGCGPSQEGEYDPADLGTAEQELDAQAESDNGYIEPFYDNDDGNMDGMDWSRLFGLEEVGGGLV